MTAREVKGRIKAYNAVLRREKENDDALAWMVGYYGMQGFHQPKKYPKNPSVIKHETAIDNDLEPMDDEVMQTMLTSFAEVHNTIEGVQGIDLRRT